MKRMVLAATMLLAMGLATGVATGLGTPSFAAEAPSTTAALALLAKEDLGDLKGHWVRVIRSMPACYTADVDPTETAKSLRKLRPVVDAWKSGAPLPTKCVMLGEGDRFMLAKTAVPGVTVAWEICTPGCSTTAANPIFMPPTAAVGRFYEPTKAPRFAAR